MYAQTAIKTTKVYPATDGQKKLLLTVLSERAVTDQAQATKRINTAEMKDVQDILAWLKSHPKVTQAPVAAEVAKVVDGFGIYQGGSGTIYSFKLKKTTGKGTWMKLVITVTEKPGDDEWLDEPKVTKTGKLVWTGGYAARQDIENGGHKLTEAEAEEFGKGHGFCIVCGRTLTDPKSVTAGIGPICAKGTMWA